MIHKVIESVAESPCAEEGLQRRAVAGGVQLPVPAVLAQRAPRARVGCWPVASRGCSPAASGRGAFLVQILTTCVQGLCT